MQKRILLLLAAALVIVIVLLYPSLGCKVSGDQIKASPLKPFTITTLEGYAIGFAFNLTNLGNCEVIAEAIHVDVGTATYPDGSVTTVNESYSESLHTSFPSGQTKMLSYTFDYVQFRPVKLVLRVEVSFGDSGSVTVFDGELEIPPP